MTSKENTSRKPRSKKTKAEVLASIDTSMETAVVAGIVDHHSQIDSWNDTQSDAVLEQVIETIDESHDDQVLSSEDVIELAAELTDELLTLSSYIDSTDIKKSASELPSAFETLSIFDDKSITANRIMDMVEANLIADGDLGELPSYVNEFRELYEPEELSAEQNSPAYETLNELLAAQNDEAVDDMVFSIAEEIDTRVSFEELKKGDGANIQRTLKKIRTQMVTKRAARVLLASNINPAFINREVHSGSKYNVYALGKLADVIYGITDGAVANAINLACIKSLFKCRDAGITFTGEVAKACASKQYQIDAAVREHLVRHTVSTSTASTQASSTMQALATLGVVKVEGSSRNPIYVMTENLIGKKLEAMLAA
jgi:hypothetical protein